MERFLDRHARDEQIAVNPLHRKQHSYTAGRHNLVNKIEKPIHSKEHALGEFLDVVGAFNLICYDSINKAAETIN